MTSVALAGDDDDMVPPCREPGCTGTIGGDGYCDSCGTKQAPDEASGSDGSQSTDSSSTGPTGSTSGPSTGRTGSRTGRFRLGEGLGRVPPEPGIDDPRSAVLEDPTAEWRKHCAICEYSVGRSRGNRPGRLKGFCGNCGHPFDFEPKLRAGDLVGQYEVIGCLAHGGVGWIYLAWDRKVGQWVVLKGLLNAGDASGKEVAKAEKDALAQTHHPNIVEIHNFVEHNGAEYIVMEYLNGPSLRQKLAQRKAANGGRPDPFPVDQAIDYILAVLPAFAYLHDRNLVYCDFKLDNVIQVGNRVKLIDLGAVRRFDDTSGDSFGTVGYQAPEIARDGVSVASDLYTVGRTLAVLTLDFRYQNKYKESLPDPATHPVLARFESFHRFLLKATAHKPADRFQSASEMREQLLGVLHEVVALSTGRPQPAPPAAFGLPPDDDTLPPLAIDPGDAAATFLANLSAGTDTVLDEIDAAVAAGQVAETPELQLRRVRALIDAGDHAAARDLLERVRVPRAARWRVAWIQGVIALASGSPGDAVGAFNRCLVEVPGELAPKLGAALAAEDTGDLAGAVKHFGIVTAVDPSYVAAARGLARCRAIQGDLEGALEAYESIPRSHRAYAEAQQEAVEKLTEKGWFEQAGQRLEGLAVDGGTRVDLEVQLLDAALKKMEARDGGSYPTISVGGAPLDERRLRSRLEDALRRRARLCHDPDERCRIIDRANRVRPTTLL